MYFKIYQNRRFSNRTSFTPSCLSLAAFVFVSSTLWYLLVAVLCRLPRYKNLKSNHLDIKWRVFIYVFLISAYFSSSRSKIVMRSWPGGFSDLKSNLIKKRHSILIQINQNQRKYLFFQMMAWSPSKEENRSQFSKTIT